MKRQIIYLALVFLFSIFLFGCKGEEVNDDNNNTFIDTRDGNSYKTVKIGNQLWMAENLKYLPSVVSSSVGSYTNTCYYVYGYNGTNVSEAKLLSNYNSYGVLYNWEAAKLSCPEGWHLPSDKEWLQLFEFAGGIDIASNKLKEKGTLHWLSTKAAVLDEFGFTALPGGDRTEDGGKGRFDDLGYAAYFWSSTEYLTYGGWYWILTYNEDTINKRNQGKVMVCSIRCIKD